MDGVRLNHGLLVLALNRDAYLGFRVEGLELRVTIYRLYTLYVPFRVPRILPRRPKGSYQGPRLLTFKMVELDGI